MKNNPPPRQKVLRYRIVSIPFEGTNSISFTLPDYLAQSAEKKAHQKKMSIAEHLNQIVEKDLADDLPLSKEQIEAGWTQPTGVNGEPFRIEVEINSEQAKELETRARQSRCSLDDYLMGLIDQLLHVGLALVLIGLAGSITLLLPGIYDNIT